MVYNYVAYGYVIENLIWSRSFDYYIWCIWEPLIYSLTVLIMYLRTINIWSNYFDYVFWEPLIYGLNLLIINVIENLCYASFAKLCLQNCYVLTEYWQVTTKLCLLHDKIVLTSWQHNLTKISQHKTLTGNNEPNKTLSITINHIHSSQ
jgi:hypothetical protein